MDPSRFDDLTKNLATTTSRRQALKAMAATVLGSVLGLAGIGTAFANCKPNGIGCNIGSQCCSGACCKGTCTDLNNDVHNCGKCGHACGSGQTCQNGTCVAQCSMGCKQLSNGTRACTCSVAADCSCGSHFCGSEIEGGGFVGGICTVLGTNTGSCLSSSQCPPGYYCNGGGTCLQACGC